MDRRFRVDNMFVCVDQLSSANQIWPAAVSLDPTFAVRRRLSNSLVSNFWPVLTSWLLHVFYTLTPR